MAAALPSMLAEDRKRAGWSVGQAAWRLDPPTGKRAGYASLMRRAVLLVMGVVAVALVVIAVMLPRYGCPEGLELIEGLPPLPYPPMDAPACMNLSPIEATTGGDELVRDANDSLAVKLAIAAIGMIVGALAVYTFARGRRAPTGLTENP